MTEHRNDVMHAAFANATITNPKDPLVIGAMDALRKFKPSRYGKWAVIRGEKSGKRQRKGSVS